MMVFPSKNEVMKIRNDYPIGSRVRLLKMDDPYANLSPGECGTVAHVDDIGTVHISWDKGSSIGAVIIDGTDLIEKI